MARSRKKTLKAIISLAGVAAGHIAAYKDYPFSMKEATNYFGQASQLALSRTWAETEIDQVIEEATRQAASFVNRRLDRAKADELTEAIERIRPEIERWVRAEMKTK